jgi:hypothetical protein
MTDTMQVPFILSLLVLAGVFVGYAIREWHAHAVRETQAHFDFLRERERIASYRRRPGETWDEREQRLLRDDPRYRLARYGEQQLQKWQAAKREEKGDG